jgi:hypothetical protein
MRLVIRVVVDRRKDSACSLASAPEDLRSTILVGRLLILDLPQDSGGRHRRSRRMARSFVIVPVIVSIEQTSFPAAVVMIAVAVIAPRSITAAFRALVQVAAIAFTQRRNVSVAAQKILTGLLADSETLLRFLCWHFSPRRNADAIAECCGYPNIVHEHVDYVHVTISLPLDTETKYYETFPYPSKVLLPLVSAGGPWREGGLCV